MKEKKYLLKSPIRVARIARLIAKLVDLFIVVVFSVALYPWGILFAVFYISISDSLQHGQSIGKKLVGFTVVSLEDGSPCSVKQSVIRNLPLSVPILVAIVPVWGWIFSAFLICLFIPAELWFIFKIDSGNRFGDVMADTTIIANDEQGDKIKKKETSWFDVDGAPSPS